jgi:hypothetical protein
MKKTSFIPLILAAWLAVLGCCHLGRQAVRAPGPGVTTWFIIE